MDFEKRFNDVLSVISPRISSILRNLSPEIKENIFEIRLRMDCPVALSSPQGVLYLSQSGNIDENPGQDSCIAEKFDIIESFKMVCGYSIYSFQNEIKNGFVTIRNGHRVGIAGTAVIENGCISTIKDVSSLNYRIARQISGIAAPIIDTLVKEDGLSDGIILAGPPSSGKTTMLRDLASMLANGHSGETLKTVVVDERGELGAVYLGRAGNDLGLSCDILNGYPKDEGILIALRCLSPDVIICDEIGTDKEVDAVQSGVNAGVPIITTVHAQHASQLLKRPQTKALLSTGAFSNIVMLKDAKNPGSISEFIKVSDLYDV